MNHYILVILAFVPMLWLLISLGMLKMASSKACFIAVIMTAVIAVCGYGMRTVYLGEAIVEGSIYSLVSICWVIVSALLVYNITLKTGALEVIKTMLSSISGDRRIQALVLGFAFGGFLEAVAGFGTAVAIPAGILIAMGFKPIKAAVVCLVSNTVPVAFGVLGVPIITLSETAGLELGKLSWDVCIQLIPFAVLLPLLIVYIVTDKVKEIKGVAIVAILSGIAFSIGQTATAVFIGVELAAIVGSLSSLLVIIIWCKVFPIKEEYHFDDDTEGLIVDTKVNGKQAMIAWLPYILVLVLIVVIQIFPSLKQEVFVISRQFYYGEGGKSITFNWLASGGTVLFIAAFISGIVQGLSVKEIIITFKETLNQLKGSILTIVLVVALAKVMTYSGMVETSAAFIAYASGKYFPLISPLIGALGTFITGSDTSSNILFGSLQQQTAVKLNLDPYWITAANGSGATAGKMISPQSISIAASATHHAADESSMMRCTIKYCVIYVCLMGIFVYAFQFLG